MCDKCPYKFGCITEQNLNEAITLKNCFRVSNIKKKTKALFFEHIEIGDILTVSLALKRVWRGGNGLNATYLRVINRRTKESTDVSLSNLARYMGYFDIQTIEA